MPTGIEVRPPADRPPWDSEHPGCTPEECGGVSYDPCDAILRTRGRWHDHQVPASADKAVASFLLKLMPDELPDSVRSALAKQIAMGAVDQVAAWLRLQESTVKVGELNNVGMRAGAWAARQLEQHREGR